MRTSCSLTTFADLEDGSSNTAAFSESTLGTGAENLSDAEELDVQTMYAFVFNAPLNDTACNSAARWNVTNRRGFSWANGEYRCTLYNHYLPPNAPTTDCMAARLIGDISTRFAVYGWRTARSNHPRGANLLRCDGSLAFIPSAVDAAVWQALATRAPLGESEQP